MTDKIALLHAPSIARIAAGKAGGDQLVTLFEMLACDAKLSHSPSLTLMVPYIDDGDEFVVGTYVPELHLVIRKVETDDPKTP